MAKLKKGDAPQPEKDFVDPKDMNEDLSGIDDIDSTGNGIIIDGVSSTILVMGCAGRQYEIYDTTGSLKLTGELNETSARIDVSGLNNGVYVLRVGSCSVKFKK